MRILKILLSIILMLVVGLGVLIFALPGEKIANLAASQVKSAIGRDLTFDGDVSFSVYPTLGVSTGAVALSNADWSDNGPMFQADSAKIGVDLMAAIGGTIKVKEVTLVAPNILLEKGASGLVNWDLSPTGAEQAGGAETSANPSDAEPESASGFTIDKLNIQDGSVRYKDHAGQDIQVTDVDAALAWEGEEATLSLSMLPFSDKVEIDAKVSNLDDLIAGEIVETDAKITAAGNTITFAGKASTIPELAGALDVDLPKPDAFMAAIGTGAAGLLKTSFKGDVTLTKEQLFSLRNGDMAYGANNFKTEADIDLKAKPVVTANIQAGALDLSAFTSGSAEASSGQASSNSGGWPTSKIDASALGLVDAKIALSASSIDTGSLKFGSSRMDINLDNSRAVATLHQFNGYDGTVSGQFVVNNRSGLSVGGTLNLAELETKDLLDDAIGIDRFTGKVSANMSFLGAGSSVDAIMKSLRGDGNLTAGRGTISGIDLDALFSGGGTGGTTVFNSGSASWVIQNGVMSNPDLRLELSSVLAKGAGDIGLGNQTINYTFTPQVRNESESGFSIPVRVEGPWSDPKIWPDLEAVINQNFAEEKEELQNKAKDAVAEKLGVTVNEGQSLEDAVEKKVEQQIEKKIEDEVGNALKSLFGGN